MVLRRPHRPDVVYLLEPCSSCGAVGERLLTRPGGFPPTAAAEISARDGAALPLSQLATRTGLVSLAAFLFVMTLAAGLREVALARSYDIQVDELIYSNVSSNLALRHTLAFYNQPFFVHPPVFFFIEAAYLRLSGLLHDRSLIGIVYSVRHLVALLAAVSAGLVFLVSMLASRKFLPALLAGLFFCLDPFLVRITSLGLIESCALMFVLAGYVALLLLADAGRASGRAGTIVAIGGAGLCFGLGLLTKEPTVFLTIVPLGICFVLNVCLRRAVAASVAAIATLVYSPYPVISAATGHWSDFYDQKVHGLLRLFGKIQETGYNQNGGPSFAHALRTQVSGYATTYLFIVLGFAAAAFLFKQGNDRHRLLAVWTFASYLYLGYSMVWGTLEEQFFYFLVVPSLISTVVAYTLFESQRNGKGALPARGLLATATVAMLAWNALTYVRVHTTPDNGYEKVAAYVGRCANPNAPIVATTLTGLLLLGSSHPAVDWAPPNELRRHGGALVLVSTKIIKEHYKPVTEAQYHRLRAVARRVYVVRGRSFGRLEVYDVLGDRSRRSHLRPSCRTAAV